ncbi:MAG: bifunctional diaminohydroxyphosphoribosylaminopyrimidine deaminase/5-amino-6-(5-phosphoribosylamino)uracil reductase RibD [Spongiibacteraceae bacterium]|nr:bifunctional diaminohydroxyphosphoribosylaminopyrimidine deaminase/5-amino-6-(5-phosphoribosylamino)uracil reductase RibD [Spongiibacteraceae bacterium]
MKNDQQFMQQAIDLAWQGLYSTSPNPRVGCVIVQQGAVIAQGYHIRAGEGHAEVNALAECDEAKGATAYVSLEPCSHTGKTPPCCETLINAGIARVVVAMQDPNPQVAGNGIKRLRAAGLQVDVGVLEEKARELNPGFIQRMESGRPYVTVKLAMSLDGRTAMASGESQWITGEQARSDVQRLRARSCAIVSGVATVMLDNALLTVRAEQLGLDDPLKSLAIERQPLRVILDSSLSLSPSAAILSQPGKTLVVAVKEDVVRERALQAAGAEVIYVDADNSRVNLRQVMTLLAQKHCNEVLVEAGATLAGAFWSQALVDKLTVYMAPTLLGSQARALMDLPLQRMEQQQRLCIESICAVGSDWRIDAHPVVA